MDLAHHHLQIEVHRLGNRYAAVTKDDQGHNIARHEFQYETTHLTYLGPAWLLDESQLGAGERARLRHMPTGKARVTQASIHGRRLYRYLFGDVPTIEGYLKAQESTEPWYLTLAFSPGASTLARLPWEYIFDGKRFPCLDGTLRISRRPLDVTPLTAAASVPPLRVLLVVAEPTDQVPFGTEEALGDIQDALEPLLRDGAAVLDLLPEPTPNALLEATRTGNYDVLHYVGHGIYHLPQHQGYLCFEDAVGRSALVSGLQLPRFLQGNTPNLVIISACRHAQVGIFDAFQSVAGDLAHCDFPAVVTLPAPLRSASGLAFYRSLYAALSTGQSVDDGLQSARSQLYEADRTLAPDERRFDWGLPVLNQRVPELTLTASVPTDGAMPTPEHKRTLQTRFGAWPLVGRHRELQGARKGLLAGARIVYIRGSDGVGKHAFANYLVTHLGSNVLATLTIDCLAIVEPLLCLAEIATFWRTHLAEEGNKAADCLLDSHRPPRERAHQAQAEVAQKRYLLLIENIDVWFGTQSKSSDMQRRGLLEEVLLGLIEEPGSAVFVFTGRRRWDALNDVPPLLQREVHLPLLSERYAIQLINYVPSLRSAAPTLPEKKELYRQIGGHPRALAYLGGWLRFANELTMLDRIAPETMKQSEEWLTSLTAALIEELDPGELAALRQLAVLRLPFGTRTVARLTRINPEHTQPLVDAWLDLALIDQRPSGNGDAPRYLLAAPVREAMRAQLTFDELTAHHRQAAQLYGGPFLEAARRQVLGRNITTWSKERIGWLARDANGILGIRLRQAQEPDEIKQLIVTALAWHHHLSESGDGGAASQIAGTLAPELNRLGQQDLSRKLLRQSLPAPEGVASDRQLDSLARLRLDEGPLLAALRVYQEVYETLDPERARLQRAYVLLRAGRVQQRLGNLAAAIQSYQAALQMIRKENEREGEAECLYRLATAYRESGEYKQALVCSQAAKEHYEARDAAVGKAALEREQGLILKAMENPERALERFVASLRLCRQIGDQACIAGNLTEIGRLFDQLGKTDTAIQVIEEALQHDTYPRGPEYGEVLTLLEVLYQKRDRVASAIARFRESKHT